MIYSLMYVLWNMGVPHEIMEVGFTDYNAEISVDRLRELVILAFDNQHN